MVSHVPVVVLIIGFSVCSQLCITVQCISKYLKYIAGLGEVKGMILFIMPSFTENIPAVVWTRWRCNGGAVADVAWCQSCDHRPKHKYI